jgi:hypothetical protein
VYLYLSANGLSLLSPPQIFSVSATVPECHAGAIPAATTCRRTLQLTIDASLKTS